jgi:hypothetical protein
MLQNLFGRPDAHGVLMAVTASAGLEDPTIIAGSCVALARDTLDAWKHCP